MNLGGIGDEKYGDRSLSHLTALSIGSLQLLTRLEYIDTECVCEQEGTDSGP